MFLMRSASPFELLLGPLARISYLGLALKGFLARSRPDEIVVRLLGRSCIAPETNRHGMKRLRIAKK